MSSESSKSPDKKERLESARKVQAELRETLKELQDDIEVIRTHLANLGRKWLIAGEADEAKWEKEYDSQKASLSRLLKAYTWISDELRSIEDLRAERKTLCLRVSPP
eukprot:CAMPEP_0201507366 /NCGR_PEP_ID=MMETSP0161_2-20130828/1047_1 /ASSEMBLY_ACC=CAM_ASM_000251 /TAXON_ID=180227 /ORGANISM="Neoparamoeba aestuarina, Strain SoJaBio B1-5/56/2" /LENGTH=106 /DNA_ID=CAMNT_0047901707 /DNA_START=165 /DNA_END=481 /DNA_ORIENTATION=+